MSSLLDPWLRGRRSTLYLDRCASWKRDPAKLPRILGHRGARHAEPENTLRAFDRALAEGAAGVELDVRMTGDGQLVVLHDAQLPENAVDALGVASRARLQDLSASQVAQVRLPKEQRIPTLQQALDWQKDTGAWLNVELKGDVPSRSHVVRTACPLLRRHGGERILVSSFYPRMLVECSLILPDVPTAWLVHAEQTLLKTAPGWRFTSAAAVHPEVRQLSPERVSTLLRKGAILNVWTVNDPKDATRLSRLGVDGLITDVPARLLVALADDPLTGDGPSRDGIGAPRPAEAGPNGQRSQSEQSDRRTVTPAGGA